VQLFFADTPGPKARGERRRARPINNGQRLFDVPPEADIATRYRRNLGGQPGVRD
jgi:hypothetical protein